MPSEPMSPCSACWMLWPPSATCSPPVDAASATSSIRWLSSTGMSGGFTTSSAGLRDQGAAVGGDAARGGVRVVDATRRAAPRRAWPAARSTSAVTAASVTGRSARTTTSTVSPDWAGNSSSSSCWAALRVGAGRGVVGLELAAERHRPARRPGRAPPPRRRRWPAGGGTSGRRAGPAARDRGGGRAGRRGPGRARGGQGRRAASWRVLGAVVETLRFITNTMPRHLSRPLHLCDAA